MTALTGMYFFIGLAAIAIRRHVEIPKSFEWNPAQASTDEFMTALTYKKHGNTSVLTLDKNYPKPIPNDNQVLIEVKASSLNPVDYKYRRNPIPNFLIPKPKIPGFDVAGVVVKVGKQVTNFRLGDRVAAMMPLLGTQWGAAADYATVEESLLCNIGNIDFESAASLPLVSLTSIQALDKIKDPKGKKILIHAGAGGVGTFAIQYAKNVLGMYVATTASKPKDDFLKSLGCDLVIDYKTQDFSKVIRNYDAVLDTMSFAYEKATLNQGANVLNQNAHYLNILSSDSKLVNGKEKSLGFLTLRNLIKHKFVNLFFKGWIPQYHQIIVQPSGEKLAQVYNHLKKGEVRPVIDKVFPLSEAVDAYDYIEKGHASGKVVLKH